MSQRITIPFIFFIIGGLFLVWHILVGPPPYLVSSFAIVVLFLFVFRKYNLISIPSFIFLPSFFPSLSFLWAWLHGATYISFYNHGLQVDDALVDGAVFLSLIAAIYCLSLVTVVNSNKLKYVGVVKHRVVLGPILYAVACLLCVVLIWLANPSLATILTARYVIVVNTGFGAGTDFAQALALICWLAAFVTYCSRRRAVSGLSGGGIDAWLDRWFVVVTLFAVIWTLLHGSRALVIGIGLVWLLLLAEQKGYRRAAIWSALFAALLFFVGEMRGGGLVYFLSHSGGQEGVGGNMRSLPGGASGIFTTFLDTLDFFKENSFLYGQTFLNYIYQIMPSFVYDWLRLDRPLYFFQKVFKGNYEHRGGTYIAAVFYGNFGSLGAVFFGLFVGLYIIITARMFRSRQFGMYLIGLFMLAISFRAFWYELIVLIKPLAVLLIPICVLVGLMWPGRFKMNHSDNPSS